MYHKLSLTQNPSKDIGHMVEEWVAFVETCAASEENEILRLTLSQVIGSGNITFVLAEPLHAFGRIYFLVMITNAPVCHVHGLVTEVPSYISRLLAHHINTDSLLYILLVENLTFRLWKVIVSLLIDDSVEVKDSMASSLCNIMQSISEGKVHMHFSSERICLHTVSHHYALAWLSEHQIRCSAIIESPS